MHSTLVRHHPDLAVEERTVRDANASVSQSVKWIQCCQYILNFFSDRYHDVSWMKFLIYQYIDYRRIAVP